MDRTGETRDGKLIFILGDQLTPRISSLRDADPARDTIFMCEVVEEASYVRHHKQKLVFVFSAMRHFAQEMRERGWIVDYARIDGSHRHSGFREALTEAVARNKPARVCVTAPGERRLVRMFEALADTLPVPLDILEDDRFLCSHAEFENWAKGRKSLLMEFFYREMRRKTGLLMNADEPEGGKWNYDEDNRKPAAGDLFMPRPSGFAPDATTREVIALVLDRFPYHFGSADGFDYAVTRERALDALDHFIGAALPHFGAYQDAMLGGQPWLYHSRLSGYINAGLLDPMEVCSAVAKAYADGDIPLNSAEGFIRQIIGWREYVRGVYWLFDDYADLNFFDAKRDLPHYYWDGRTDMNCMAQTIGQTLDHAYAHHIQRLMITGNFALLAGLAPGQVHEWYLAVYFDAYEWVEMPNTLGMALFADGGLLGTKPYCASGAYIDRMSDYCGSCRYDVRKKTGRESCPFNSLYWDFLARNRSKLARNTRLARAYATWDRLDSGKQEEYRNTAAHYLEEIENL